MRNPYDVLGVARDADHDTIRKAYKDLARKYHPDRNKSPAAEPKFKEATSAYDVVGDDEKRKLYDEFGDLSLQAGFDAAKARAWGARGAGEPRTGSGFGGFDFGSGDGPGVDDILSSFFGMGGGARAGARRGRDQQVTILVAPMLSFVGGETSFMLPRAQGSETLKVRIPAGVSDGGMLRLKGQGHPPPGGGPCGDLLLKLEIPAHSRLHRVGDDLELEVPITVLEAVRGGAITVPTPTGDVKVQIPVGTSSGARLRLRGKGVQKKTQPGDLYLVLHVALPTNSGPELIAAAEQIEKSYDKAVRSDLTL